VSPDLLLQRTSKPEVRAVTVQKYSRLKAIFNCDGPRCNSDQHHHNPHNLAKGWSNSFSGDPLDVASLTQVKDEHAAVGNV
jgi:hypothetical protein